MGGSLQDYEPVEDRLRDFWEQHPMGRVITELVSHNGGSYIVKASVYRGDELRDNPPAATGLAHDDEATLPANMKASALEVCETSAIGRALANLGYAPKGKRPSHEEMSKTAAAGPTGKVEPAAADDAGGTDARRVPGHGGEGADPGGQAPGGAASSPTHEHLWKPSPVAHMATKGWKVCAHPGCGETKKGRTDDA